MPRPISNNAFSKIAMSDETEDPNSLHGDSRYWTFWIKVHSGRLHSTFYEYRQTFKYKKKFVEIAFVEIASWR